MKNKTIFILVIAVFIITSFTINHSYANENDKALAAQGFRGGTRGATACGMAAPR